MTKETVLDYSRRIPQASPTELVVITYELIDLNIKDALDYQASNEVQYRYSLTKARNLLGELIRSVDLQYTIGGELLRLYLFMNRELLQADIRKDTTDLPRIRNMIRELRSAFSEVAKTDKSGPVMENTQKVYAGLTYSKGSLNEDLTGDPNRGFKV